MNKRNLFLLFIIIFCSLVLITLIAMRSEGFSASTGVPSQTALVVVYEKASPKNCGQVLTFSERVNKYPIQFIPETIEIADGYVVYLYSHPDTENSYATLTKGSYDFTNVTSTTGVLIKDRIYITIEIEELSDGSRKTVTVKNCKEPVKAIIAYEHCGYGGRSITLGEGRHNGGFLNRHKFSNIISALRIPSGSEAILYDGDNFNGSSKTYQSNVSCLVNNKFNDKASSIEVRSSKPQQIGKLTSSFSTNSQYIIVYDSPNYKGHYIYIPVTGGGGEKYDLDKNWDITFLKWDKLKNMGMPQGGNISIKVPYDYIVLLVADSGSIRYSQHVINSPGIQSLNISSHMGMYIYKRKMIVK